MTGKKLIVIWKAYMPKEQHKSQRKCSTETTCRALMASRVLVTRHHFLYVVSVDLKSAFNSALSDKIMLKLAKMETLNDIINFCCDSSAK